MPALRPILLAAALLVHVPLLAEGDPQTHAVVATNFVWTPMNLTIAPGDSVTFSSAQGMHTFVSDSGDGATCNPLPCTRTYATAGRYDFHCGVHPVMRGTISVGTPPTVSISSPSAGSTLSGSVTVSGSATHATETVKVVQLRVDGVLVGSAVPGAGGSWSATWDTTLSAEGARTLVATALTTPTDLAGTASVGVTLDNPDTVDLRAVSLTGTMGGSLSATLTYTIENFGNVASGPFAMAFEYHYKGTWRPIGSQSHAGLGAFETDTGTFLWSGGLHVGRYPVRVVLDPAGLVAETSETNNEAAGTAAWLTPLVNGLDPLDP